MALHITRLSGALGATVEGVKLDDLDAQADELRRAWTEHEVIVFPQIAMDPDQQLALASVFGQPEAHGVDGDDTRSPVYADDDKLITVIDSHKAGAHVWHTDATFRQHPPLGALLQLTEKPDAGGDTMWLSTTTAFDTLAAPLQDLCRRLQAEHGRPPVTGQAEHPVVRTHPVSGREILYVNRGWTNRLKGLPRLQAVDLLELLLRHIERPEHSMRWSWQIGDAVLWDNRCTQHYAIYDYGDQLRGGHRVILADPAA